MLSRRGFLQTALAATGGGMVARRVDAQDRFDQADLLRFDDFGQLTFLHISDVRGQWQPAYFRPAAVNIGVGNDAGEVPYLTGEVLRIRYGIGGRTPMDYALTHENFVDQARAYGKMGGVAHVATVVRAVQAVRPQTQLLMGGHEADAEPSVAAVLRGVGAADPTTGAAAEAQAAAVDEITQKNDLDNFAEMSVIKGIRIAVIRHAAAHLLPHISPNPLSVDALKSRVDKARAAGAKVVIYLSSAGLHADRHIAREVPGLTAIFSAQSHLALPEPVEISGTSIIASGGEGRFVSRVDMAVSEGGEVALRHKLIPVFAELIAPDSRVAALIKAREPEGADREIGRAGALLYRGGTVTSTWDRIVCDALVAQQGVDFSMVPGFRWGESLLPGQPVTPAVLDSLTRGVAAEVSVQDMSGQQIKDALEASAEARFSSDPLARNGLDMMRMGGVGFTLSPGKANGARISNLVDLARGAPLQMSGQYRVSDWAVSQGIGNGPEIMALLQRYVRRRKRIEAGAAHVVVV